MSANQDNTYIIPRVKSGQQVHSFITNKDEGYAYSMFIEWCRVQDSNDVFELSKYLGAFWK